MTFNLFLLEGVFVGWLGGGLLMVVVGDIGQQFLDWMALLLLGADSLVRFNQCLKMEVDRWWGFGEWLWPGTHRPPGAAGLDG